MRDLILVVAHKDFDDSILPAGYRVCKVGNKLSNEFAAKKGWLTDDTSDNIADENPYYCELTAHYWAWKNVKDVDIIGLVHYRRYFMDYSQHASSVAEGIVRTDEIEKILRKYKVILQYWGCKDAFDKRKPIEEQSSNWTILRNIVQQHYPAMLTIFDRIVFGHKQAYQNMLITSKAIFDEYSKWIFDVLQKYDEAIEAKGEQRTPRVDGFLSETLLNVWMLYTFKGNEIYHLPVLRVH